MTENNGEIMIGFLSDKKESIRGKLKIPVIRDQRCITNDNKEGIVQFTGTGDMFAACLTGHSGTLTI